MLTIDRATILEWPQIEAMARTYFDRMGREYQDRRESATWWVARKGERVCGCYATMQTVEPTQVYITDLYRTDGFDGARATVLLYRHAYTQAEQAGQDVIIMIDPRNTEWQAMVERYSDAELVALVYLRRNPGGV